MRVVSLCRVGHKEEVNNSTVDLRGPCGLMGHSNGVATRDMASNRSIHHSIRIVVIRGVKVASLCRSEVNEENETSTVHLRSL